jgi:hypothetical protein
MLAQLLNRRGCTPVMDEDTSGLLPEVTVSVAIVDQRIARVAVFALQGRTGGDDLYAWKVPRGSAPLLRLCPSAAW